MTKHLGIFARNSWERAKYFVVHNILHADDPPHRLALGVALAMFVTFTPTIGFQMALVFFLAWLFRANKLVGVPLVWISNPATMVPILYFNYCVGRFFGGGTAIGGDWFEALRHPPIGTMARIEFYWNRLAEIAIPLWIGSIVVGTTLGVVSYYVTLWSVRTYRMKAWGQLTPPRTDFDSTPDDSCESGSPASAGSVGQLETSEDQPSDESGDQCSDESVDQEIDQTDSDRDGRNHRQQNQFDTDRSAVPFDSKAIESCLPTESLSR